ncbi:MAG: DUF2281 domain-containing protein, partial [Chloroflexota bacterium]
ENEMSQLLIRDRLYKLIDLMPDELVEQVADFAAFLAAKQKNSPAYHDWDERQWQEFALREFFRDDGEEGEEVEYSLNDAREVYHT